VASTGGNSSGGVLHDTVKDMVCRWAEGHGYGFEKEARVYQEQGINKYRPDVVLTLTRAEAVKHTRKTKVFIEVQRDCSTKWMADHINIYAGKDWICLNIERGKGLVWVVDGWMDEHLETLYKAVCLQLDNETATSGASRTQPSYQRPTIQCSYCLMKVKNIKQHEYNCKMKRIRSAIHD